MYYLAEDGSRVYTFKVSSKYRENILFIEYGGLVLCVYVIQVVVLCRIFWEGVTSLMYQYHERFSKRAEEAYILICHEFVFCLFGPVLL